MVRDEDYILRSINRHGHFGNNPNPARNSTIYKALQLGLGDSAKVKPLSGHSFKVGAAIYLLKQGEPLEKIVLSGEWQPNSTAMKYLKNWYI